MEYRLPQLKNMAQFEYKELEWTVLFYFPEGSVYPTKNNEYQSELNSNVMSWNNKEEAEAFAKSKCGKYSWILFPTVVECFHWD